MSFSRIPGIQGLAGYSAQIRLWMTCILQLPINFAQSTSLSLYLSVYEIQPEKEERKKPLISFFTISYNSMEFKLHLHTHNNKIAQAGQVKIIWLHHSCLQAAGSCLVRTGSICRFVTRDSTRKVVHVEVK